MKNLRHYFPQTMQFDQTFERLTQTTALINKLSLSYRYNQCTDRKNCNYCSKTKKPYLVELNHKHKIYKTRNNGEKNIKHV